MMENRNCSYNSVPLIKAIRRKPIRPDISLRTLTGILEREMKSLSRERTARAYRSAMSSFLNFYGKEDLALSQLNGRLLVEYEQYLLVGSRSLNTISFYMRNLRAIYNKGISRGLFTPVEEELFRLVYTGNHPTRERAIPAKDIWQLESWIRKRELGTQAVPDPHLFSAYCFLFCFYARGMSYVDMAYLKKTDIRDGLICYRRRKTGLFLKVKLIQELQKIIDLVAPYVKDSPYVFPIILRKEGKERLQYESGLRLQNKRLKEVAIQAGLRCSLSTHVARHSWATIAKKEHIPLPVISESLGHASLKTTAIYLASFDNNLLDKANLKVVRAIKRAG
ncbi:MAG: site-specific integrase [Tannerellaceae bacterium]|nr:site-specific integrase [Tannerellaceae bacterium]